MGTKVHPTGLRLGNHINWDSSLRTSKFDYANAIHQNLQIKTLIRKTLKDYGIIVGKLFIRQIKTKTLSYKIQGSYYITLNTKTLIKKQNSFEKNLFNDDLNNNIDIIINKQLNELIRQYLNKIDSNIKCELDLTNVLNLGQYHTSLVAKKGIKQMRGPMTRLPYTKDLFMVIHKMMLLKDSTILGETIVPLLEKTTKHHQAINNIESLCQLVFNQYKGLRGFRIDIKAIETQIRRFDLVKDCHVFVHKEKIIAAVITKKKNINLLNDYLIKNLPYYMQPKEFKIYSKFPLNRSHKINYKFIEENYLRTR